MKTDEHENVFLAALNGTAVRPAPIWLMRQAGRYLPEYQAVRKTTGSFWGMCMNPELASEVTLQPIRRFDFDAAILFSDILTVPFALGQQVRFEDGSGPSLEPFSGVSFVRDEKIWAERLAPVYDAMARTRASLDPAKALIGFVGGPWTLAAYMIDGHGTPDQRQAKLYAYREPEKFSALLQMLVETVTWHLGRQIEAGADTVQIFESWAVGLPAPCFLDWVVAPSVKIVSSLRVRYPHVKIIGFPRATSQWGYETYFEKTKVDGIGIDTATPMGWAAKSLGGRVALQGNLDPIALIAGGAALDRAIDQILEDTRELPFVFNLGHGVLPETPLDHVARLVHRVREHG